MNGNPYSSRLGTIVLLLVTASTAAWADCPASFTNLGFNGETFPGGVAPGWRADPDNGVTFSRRTGPTLEGGVAQNLAARNGWDQKSLLFQVGTVCPGSEYELRVTAQWLATQPTATRWTSGVGMAHGSGAGWGEMERTVNFWGYGTTPASNTVTLRFVATDSTVTVMIFMNIAWSDAWVDDMVITEIGQATIPPTATRTPTSTPFNTYSPTPTVPAYVGPNLLVNGGFEGGFSGGLANGWASFTPVATGYTKRSAQLGRIGGGIYGYSTGNEDNENVRMSAKTYLVDLSRYDLVLRLRQELGDDVITIAKTDAETLFPGGDPYSNPEANGRTFAEWWRARSARDGWYAHAYYGVNEPDMNNVENLKKAARFDLAYTRRLHELGLRSIVLNHAFGTPANLNNMLIEEVRALLAEADYVGYHAYADPRYNQMCDPRGFDIVERYRQIVAMYEARGWRIPPVIYTEGGDHGIDPNGFPSPAHVRDDLVCYEGVMRQSPWALGMCYFVTATWPGGWDGYDITRYPEIITACRQVNQAHPVDAHSGLWAQQFGGNRTAFDRGVVQQITTQPGKTYIFDGWFSYTFYDGAGATPAWPSSATLRVGWDPTGQTSHPDAATVQWSGNLIGHPLRETDMWFRVQRTFVAAGTHASLWVRGAQAAAVPAVRIGMDDLSLRQDLTEGTQPGSPILWLR